jgi:hypothetical protein
LVGCRYKTPTVSEGFSWERALKNGICSAPITIQNAFDQVFEPSPLKILNAANNENILCLSKRRTTFKLADFEVFK